MEAGRKRGARPKQQVHVTGASFLLGIPEKSDKRFQFYRHRTETGSVNTTHVSLQHVTTETSKSRVNQIWRTARNQERWIKKDGLPKKMAIAMKGYSDYKVKQKGSKRKHIRNSSIEKRAWRAASPRGLQTLQKATGMSRTRTGMQVRLRQSLWDFLATPWKT